MNHVGVHEVDVVWFGGVDVFGVVLFVEFCEVSFVGVFYVGYEEGL